jgi:hypothetical protein
MHTATQLMQVGDLMKFALSILAIATFAVSPLFAQPGGPGGRGGEGGLRRGPGGGGPGTPGSGGLENAGLKVGNPLPDITIHDAQGNPFRMTDLKGKHSVVVFGCLT